MERVICLLIGYAFGLFQTGFIYGKLHHIDIRQHGSGNAGTTNALRTLGWKAGFTTFAGDVLKVIFASLVVAGLYKSSHPDNYMVLKIYSGIGCVLGHNFPFYLKFKGGKGIAATAGVIISLGSPQIILVGLFFFFLTLYLTRYVSSASLNMLLSTFGGFVVMSHLGKIHGIGTSQATIEAVILMFIFVVLGFVRHKANIKRLLTGTENELVLKKHMAEEKI